MQYLYDENGKRYLDCFGGIVTVSCGHCHPDIVNAVVEQTKLLQHTTTIYLHHAIVEFAEALTSKMPGNLKVKLKSTVCLCLKKKSIVCLGAVIMRTIPFMCASKTVRVEGLCHVFWVLQVAYFVNSGTEANELAMLMARLYSGNLSMVALRNAYHGGSAGTIGLTGLQTWKYPIPQVCVL